jgi:hypothetical protein
MIRTAQKRSQTKKNKQSSVITFIPEKAIDEIELHMGGHITGNPSMFSQVSDAAALGRSDNFYCLRGRDSLRLKLELSNSNLG